MKLVTKIMRKTVFAGDHLESLHDHHTYRLDSWKPGVCYVQRIQGGKLRGCIMKSPEEFGLEISRT